MKKIKDNQGNDHMVADECDDYVFPAGEIKLKDYLKDVDAETYMFPQYEDKNKEKHVNIVGQEFPTWAKRIVKNKGKARKFRVIRR